MSAADIDEIEIISLNTHTKECAMCGAESAHRFAVPWYEEPVRMEESQGGYACVCKACYNKWEAWDSGRIAQLW